MATRAEASAYKTRAAPGKGRGVAIDFREIMRAAELENLWELICLWQSMAQEDLTVLHCHFFRLLWAAE